jgi:hypothetical protein
MDWKAKLMHDLQIPSHPNQHIRLGSHQTFSVINQSIKPSNASLAALA